MKYTSPIYKKLKKMTLNQLVLLLLIFSLCITTAMNVHPQNYNTSGSGFIPNNLKILKGGEGNSQNPDISVSLEGRVDVVWENYLYTGPSTPAEEKIYHAHWNNTSDSPEYTMLSSTGTDPSITHDNLGNVHVVWQDSLPINSSGTDLDILYKCWNSSTSSWMNTQVISTESTLSSTNPVITHDGGGIIYVVWSDDTDLDGAGEDSDIFCRKYDSLGGYWSGTVVVSIDSSLNSHNPDIGVNSNDYPYVVWQEDSGSSILLSRLNIVTQIWYSSTLISTESDSSGLSSQEPSMIIDKFDNVFIVWEDNFDLDGADEDYDIFYKYMNGSTFVWGNTIVVPTFYTSVSRDPDIGVDGSGNVLISWSDNYDLHTYSAGDDSDIFYKWYDPINNAWGVTGVISTESSGPSTQVKLGFDSLGNAHVVWQDTTNYLGFYGGIFYKSNIDILTTTESITDTETVTDTETETETDTETETETDTETETETDTETDTATETETDTATETETTTEISTETLTETITTLISDLSSLSEQAESNFQVIAFVSSMFLVTIVIRRRNAKD